MILSLTLQISWMPQIITTFVETVELYTMPRSSLHPPVWFLIMAPHFIEMPQVSMLIQTVTFRLH